MDRASVTNRGSAALVQESRAVTQPPGKTVYQVAARPGPWSVRSKRWAPGWSEGRWMVAVVSQVALSRTTRNPTSYLRRVNIDHPFLAADGLVSSGRFTNLQPAGNDGTHGARESDGTDWAISHNGSRSAAQSRLVRLSRVVVWSLFSTASRAAGTRTATSGTTASSRPTRRALHRW